MKKNLLLLACILFLFSCGNKGTEEKKENSEPEKKVDNTPSTGIGATFKGFPDVIYNLKEGDFVLSPNGKDIMKLLEVQEGKAKEYEGSLMYHSRTIVSSKPKSSVIKGIMENEDIDHRFIIPIPKGQKAKKGDIILTWGQSDKKNTGYTPNLTRAIVTDDSNPSQPKVSFLPFMGLPSLNKTVDVTLAENSFMVLKDDFVVGNVVHTEGKYGPACFYIRAIADDKLLLGSLSGHISVKSKSECKLMNFKPTNLKAGDKVQFELTALENGTVKEVNADKGMVTISYEPYKGKPAKTTYVPFGLVTQGVELKK